MEFNEEDEEKDVKEHEKKSEVEEVTNELNNNEANPKEQKNVEEDTKKESRKSKIIIVSIVAVIVLLIIMFLCSIFAILNMNNNRIIKGITINQTNVENLTIEEAIEKIKEEENNKLEKDINIKYNDFEYSIKLSQIEVTYKIEEAVKEAFNTGRNNNIFADNYNILKTRIKKKNINIEYEYNEKLLDEIIDDIAVKIPGAVIEPSYYIENKKLYISKGKTGVSVEKKKLKY